MARFYTEADMDISPDEFLEECSNSEIKTVLDWLLSNEYITGVNINKHDNIRMSIQEEEFNKCLINLRDTYYNLTNEELEVISKLSKKFR